MGDGESTAVRLTGLMPAASTAAALGSVALAAEAVLTAEAALTTLTAEAALAAAAHRRTGDGVDLHPVDDYRSAVKFSHGVVVERGHSCGDVDGTAVYVDGAVGIERIGVALTDCDFDIPAVYRDGRGSRRSVLSGSIDAVVAAVEVEVAVVDSDNRCLNRLRTGDFYGAAVELCKRCGLNTVAFGRDGEAAAADIDPADSVVFVVLTVEPVLTGVDDESAILDCDGIIGLEAVQSGCDIVRAAGDFQVILAADAVVGGFNGEGAETVQYQVILAENHSVSAGIAVGGKGVGDGEGAAGAFCGGDKYFVSVLDVNNRSIVVGDIQRIKSDLNLGFVIGFDDDGIVFSGAGDYINAGGGDGFGGIICGGVVNRFGKIRALSKVPISEQSGRIGGFSAAGILSRGAGF